MFPCKRRREVACAKAPLVVEQLEKRCTPAVLLRGESLPLDRAQTPLDVAEEGATAIVATDDAFPDDGTWAWEPGDGEQGGDFAAEAGTWLDIDFNFDDSGDSGEIEFSFDQEGATIETFEAFGDAADGDFVRNRLSLSSLSDAAPAMTPATAGATQSQGTATPALTKMASLAAAIAETLRSPQLQGSLATTIAQPTALPRNAEGRAGIPPPLAYASAPFLAAAGSLGNSEADRPPATDAPFQNGDAIVPPHDIKAQPDLAPCSDRRQPGRRHEDDVPTITTAPASSVRPAAVPDDLVVGETAREPQKAEEGSSGQPTVQFAEVFQDVDAAAVRNRATQLGGPAFIGAALVYGLHHCVPRPIRRASAPRSPRL